MQDQVEAGTKHLQAWTVRVARGKAESVRKRLVNAATEAKVELLVMRSDMVFGLGHVRSALYHALRAIREGRNSSDSLAMETLLYASGERQLSSAISKMSPDVDSEEVVVAQLTPGKLDHDDSWTPLGDSMRGDRSDLARFGVSQEELATVGNGRELELVLEKVASVDVLKK